MRDNVNVISLKHGPTGPRTKVMAHSVHIRLNMKFQVSVQFRKNLAIISYLAETPSTLSEQNAILI